jgi:lipoprotein NlpI
MMTAIVILALLALNEEPKTAAEWAARAAELGEKKEFAQAEKAYDKAIELDAKKADLFDQRGSVRFMQSKFAESVADFDQAIKLDPKRADGHWRRGISLYYAAKYDEGKKQFEGYEKVDTNDVENAVWHFLCAAKKDGIASARKGLLKIGKDKRTPMMEVYELFKGTLNADAVMKAANAGELPEKQKSQQLFYAHLYLGIWADLNGDAKKAKEHLELAANKYQIAHYMGEVARVHLELVEKKK